jgi:hypothetical protein
MLLAISSLYAKRGVLWDSYQRHYGKNGDPVLVWQAPTLDMSPTVDGKLIAEAFEADVVIAASEYGAEFRSDLESSISAETVAANLVPGRAALPPAETTKYHGFCDPSVGSRDTMTLAIAHAEKSRVVLDCVVERRPPFSPEAVVKEFAPTLTQYGVSKVVGDRYAGEWPREQIRRHGIAYEPSQRTKSELYAEILPLLNSRRAELLGNPRLIPQLLRLERRTSRRGRDSIDHPPNSTDDVINASTGALAAATAKEAGCFLNSAKPFPTMRSSINSAKARWE